MDYLKNFILGTYEVISIDSLSNISAYLLGNNIVFIVTVFLVILTCIGGALLLYRSYRLKHDPKAGSTGPKPRFRKRDKVLFYGRKMLRKVRSISAGANKRKKIISKLTRKLLMKKETSPTQLQVLEPPAEYLQEDESTVADQRLPPEVTYMLKSIRIFGIFERPLFLELCKHMETLHVSNGQYLFRIGDPDENFYVVQSGRLNVFITEADGSTISLKTVRAGDSIASLLSFADVLTGHPQPYKTVSAQSMEESVVLKLPVASFQEVFEKNPETFVRVIQIIMIRLHRVTFTALHQHLGLTSELVQASNRRKSVMYSASPTRRNTLYHPMHQPMDENSRTPDLLDAEVPVQAHPTQSFTGGSESSTNPLYRQASQHGLNARRKSAAIPIQLNAHPSLNLAGSAGSFGTSLTDDLPLEEELYENSLTKAIEIFRNSLKLEDDSFIRSVLSIREVPAGSYITKEDSHEDSGLVLVLSGLLSMSQRENERDVLMYHAHPGDFVGAMTVLTGEPSVFTVRAKIHTRVAVLRSSDFYELMAIKPKVVLHVAHLVVRRLSPFVRQIDFAMDWDFLESGRALYKQKDESDSTFIILSGRLRSVITRNDGKKQLIGEYGRGDLVGVVETLTSTPRSTTVIAVRDTELAKLPEGLLNAIKLKYPIVVTRLINLLGRRIIGNLQQPSYMFGNQATAALDNKPTHVNFSTIAVLGVTEDVPIPAFTYELINSLSTISPSLRLTSDYVKKVLGQSIMEGVHEYKLNSWLAQQEDKHRIVLYQCDSTMSAWTLRCIRQADCILIVGMGDGEPTIGTIEKQLEHLAVRTQRELVLLHKEGGERPKNTALWLNARTWCSSHHHLQCPKRMFSKKAKNSEYHMLMMRTETSIHSDFSRLARWLTGTSVGIVLGGGGARGAAHIGMIKAIQEAGIPIDMVGGVSIGAFMGALWCAERNVTTMTQKAREWSQKMNNWWRQIWDLTYPATSMFSGSGFNQTIRDTHSDVQIEDLWLPFFIVTTDITSSAMRVHSHGSLWRYVRASMSLSGYMPPLCDPVDGHLLLDGGYCNNLPGDIMRNRGARHILAIDVGSQDDTDLTNYGDSLSGWWLLWHKWTSHFRSSSIKVPDLPDIQSRLAYVSCVKQLEEVRNSDYCHYVRPPIDKYKTLQFGSFDEIKEVGYNHGKTYFDGMMRGNLIPSAGNYGSQPQYLQRVASSRSLNLNANDRPSGGAYNFTDLAQMVCKVKSNYPAQDPRETDDDCSDEEDYPEQETGYNSEPPLEFLRSDEEIKGDSLLVSQSPTPEMN